MPEWASLRFAVIDVEGNGQQPPELAELAVVPIISGTVGDPTTWLVRPKRPITYFATCVHGITKADVVGAPLFEAIAR